MKLQSTVLLMSVLLIQATVPSSPEYKDGKYYEPNTDKPYSGYLTRYYNNTTTKESEGKVRDGLMNDIWTFYYPNGVLKSEMEYEEGVRIKILHSNYETGEKQSEFDDSTQVYTTWYKSGKVKSVTHYLYGLKQGASREWYENGHIKSDYTYYTHHEHGVCKEYFENGQVALVAVYRDGKKSGFWQAFYPDGKLKFQGRYSEDSKTGKWVERNGSGKLVKQLF
jgi:antitoxin component YwqK of YwqJK toxin-antitoxin module